MASIREIARYLMNKGGGGGGSSASPAPAPRKSHYGYVIPPVKDVAPPRVDSSKGREYYRMVQSPIPTDKPSSRAARHGHPAGESHRQNTQGHRNAHATRNAEMPQRVPWYQRPFRQPQGQDRRAEYPAPRRTERPTYQPRPYDPGPGGGGGGRAGGGERPYESWPGER